MKELSDYSSRLLKAARNGGNLDWFDPPVTMSRSGRKRKLEQSLAVMEAEFRSKLVDALHACEAGRWGLFGQNDHLSPESSHAGIAAELLSLGEQIRRFRMEFGVVEGFEPYERLLEYRKLRSANTVGEPKLAAAFLRELT